VERSAEPPAAALHGSKSQDMPRHGEPGWDEQERTELISTIVTVKMRWHVACFMVIR